MKTLRLSLIVFLIALGASAEMIVNSQFSSAIGSTGADVIDPDGSANNGDTALIIDAGWFSKTGLEFYLNNNALVRDPASATRWSYVGIGQIMTADANNGEKIRFMFDQTVVDADGNSGYEAHLFGYDNIGTGTPGTPESWLVNSGDGIDLLNPAGGDDTGRGNYNVYELANATFTSGAANYSTDITLTRDYEYFGIEFVSKAQNNDSWTIDNVSLDAVPEPATLGLLAMGSLIALAARRLHI